MASDPFKAALTHYRASQKSPRRASSQDWYHSSSRSRKPVKYGKVNPIVKPKTSKQDQGILDNILSVAGNLGGDVVDTVEGIPGGIVETVRNPIKTARAIGHDYRNRYGPLFGYLTGEGDIGKFASGIKEHPLAPILDVATVLTAGGGAVAKVGQAGRVAKTLGNIDAKGGTPAAIAARTKVVKMAPVKTKLYDMTKGGYREIAVSKGGSKGIKVPLQNNPIKRLRRNLGISFQEKVLPVKTPLIGLRSRALKTAANEKLQRTGAKGTTRYVQRRVIAAVDAMTLLAGKDTKKLDSMANAADYLVSGVDPLKHAETIKTTRLDPVHHEKMREAKYSEDEIQAAMDHALKPALDPQAKKLFDAAQAHYQRAALAAGKQIPEHLLVRANKADIDSPEVQAIVKVRDAHDAAADHAMAQMVKAGKLAPDEISRRRVLHVTTVELLGRGLGDAGDAASLIKQEYTRQAKQFQSPKDKNRLVALRTKRDADLERIKEDRVPLTPEEVDKAYDAAGLPRPVYNPDTISVGSSSKAGKFGDSGDYASGDRVVAPMNIIMRHEWASKVTDAQHAHTLLTSLGTFFESGAKPENYVWVRDNMPKTIEYTRDLGLSQAESGIAASQKFYEALRSETRPDSGLAVERQIFDEMTVGRAAMTAARHTGITKAVNIWKWAILATRPGFLTVNVISNQLMYHLKNGWDFRAFRNANQVARGAFDEHHAVAGATWGDSELGLKSGKKLKWTRDLMYTLTGIHEHALRRYTMYETARKMPQVQRELRSIKGGKFKPDFEGQTMFHQAYNRAIGKHPHIRDMVTKNMDDTLGNYRYYTQTEQALKNISPFYGWERHSVRNFLRMAEDNPAQMAMLTAVGAQGNEKFLRDFGKGMPDFVHTYVMDSYFKTVAKHLGMGDKVTSYDFGPLNPWKTAVDVGKATLKGDAKHLIQMAGPLATGPLEEFTGKNPLTGAPALKTHTSNAILSTIERVIHQTPPVTLTENLVTDKYKKSKMLKKTKGQVLGQYAGAAFKSPDLDLLRKSKEREDGVTKKRRKYRKYKSTAKGYYG